MLVSYCSSNYAGPEEDALQGDTLLSETPLSEVEAIGDTHKCTCTSESGKMERYHEVLNKTNCM